MAVPFVSIQKTSEIVSTWRVEANDIDAEGGVEIATFACGDAEHRAREYAKWKYPDVHAAIAA